MIQAGFSAFNHTYSLPDSGTSDAITLAEKSDIGIPGEWLMQIDSEQVLNSWILNLKFN